MMEGIVSKGHKRLADLMKEKKLLSFEVFPPKTEMGEKKLKETLSRLSAFLPDYISCTYGAGGSNVGKNLEVLHFIEEAGENIRAVTHFTCQGNTKESAKRQLDDYLSQGVSTILALRGDIPKGENRISGDFAYATDLVDFIKKEYKDTFEIAVSGSPEGHIECKSLEEDILYLKQKEELGADYIMTQLTFDMEQFKRWLDAIRKAGVTMPVDVGVMPVLKKEAVLNMCLSRNACAIPRKLAEIFSHSWFTEDEKGNELLEVRKRFREEGIAYTVNQIKEYRTLGVNGIHLYTLNAWQDCAEILDRAGI